MKKVFLSATMIVALIAGPSLAANMPPKFKKCKACHGLPGAGKGKVGPDLATSEWSIEEWVKQVQLGSKRNNRPPKMAKYAKKKMPKLKKYTEADIKVIYDYVQAAKK